VLGDGGARGPITAKLQTMHRALAETESDPLF
jgi:hypothetical protein